MQPLLFFFSIYITISYATAAEFLKNPDFEIPPANVTANSIPGWSVNGTVWYVASGNNGGGGRAVQLGPNGKISQRLTATGNYNNVLDYIVSFTLGAQNLECANNRTALNVTLRDNLNYYVSRAIYMLKNSSTNLRERHSFKVPQMGGKDYVDIHIQSAADNDNVTCWPLVDAFTVNTNQMPIWYDGNMLSNGGFEVGPAFVKKSGNGIILNEEDDEFYSPLQQWSVMGSIRYIDSGHYKVGGGRAAVELVSGGVQKDLPTLPMANSYSLNFTVGDANDSCAAPLVVHVRVGASAWDFAVKSNGTGSAFRHSVVFRVEASTHASLMFYSDEETVSGDGVLCGPVLDDVILVRSFGGTRELCHRILFIAFLIIVIVFVG